MRILLIHPEDELVEEPWASLRWDRVIDLGKSGAESYATAADRFGCPISGLAEFRDNFRMMHRIRGLLALGMGRLTDEFGLDWWELTSILVHQQFETVVVLQTLAESLGPLDEVYITRPGFQGDALELSLGSRLHTFSLPENRRRRSVRHYVRVLRKLPKTQLLDIFWDKTDPGYQFRGTFRRRGKRLSGPVVLLPSAYVNVSRTGIGYARSLPQAHFLLVATRRSGWLDDPPSNVSVRWLSRYASVRASSRKLEHQDLVRRWGRLRSELRSVPEIFALDKFGFLDDFAERFARGLEIRDAWRNVLDSEPVEAVICADDANPYTHIPLLLASKKGLATIACHHGALDGRYLFKRRHADVLLAKGKMEEDYLVRLCGIERQAVEIGAPILPEPVEDRSGGEKPFIMFFSEAYEVAGGRAKACYRDVLPPLADLALSEGRKLVIKLHPFESISERGNLIRQILSPEQQAVVQIVAGPLQPELLNRTWFGVTVMSTVVIECVLQRIPCFLCAWLESLPYGYVDQFTRFGVGVRLSEPADVKRIPSILRNYPFSKAARENCWIPIEMRRFEELLGLNRRSQVVAGAD